MFKSLRSTGEKTINHSGRSHIGETMQIEGDLRTAGSIDVAGLVNGNMFVQEMTITETGSIRGSYIIERKGEGATHPAGASTIKSGP